MRQGRERQPTGRRDCPAFSRTPNKQGKAKRQSAAGRIQKCLTPEGLKEQPSARWGCSTGIQPWDGTLDVTDKSRPPAPLFLTFVGHVIPAFCHGIPVLSDRKPLAHRGIPLAHDGIPVFSDGIPLARHRKPRSRAGRPRVRRGIPTVGDGVPVSRRSVPARNRGKHGFRMKIGYWRHSVLMAHSPE